MTLKTVLPIAFVIAAHQSQGLTDLSGQREIYDGNGGPFIPGTYLLGNAVVPEGQTLTIQPGAVVKFNWLGDITVSGTLNARGSSLDNASGRILFTVANDDASDAGEKAPGSDGNPQMGVTQGIYAPAGGQLNLSNAVIRYAGGNRRTLILESPAAIANCVITKCVGPAVYAAADVTLDGLEIDEIYEAYGSGQGVLITGDDPLDVTIRNTNITNCANQGIYLDNAIHLPALTMENVSMENNGYNAVCVQTHHALPVRDTGYIYQSGTIDIPNPVYIEGWLKIGDANPNTPSIAVTVQPGVIFRIGGGIMVNDTFNVEGTPETGRVIFTSYTDNGDDAGGDITSAETTPAPAHWEGLQFEPGSHGAVNNAVFRYGGANNCPLRLHGETAVSNSLVTESQAPGVSIQADAALENVTIRNLTHPWGSESYSGANGITISGGNSAHVTLRGCTIEEQLLSGIAIGQTNSLTAENVTITGCISSGITADLGSENFITLTDCKILNNHAYGLLLHGGGEAHLTACSITGNQQDGILLAEGNRKLEVQGGSISNNQMHGVRLLHQTSVSGQGMLIEGNGEDGVHVASLGSVAVSQSDITGNTGWGVGMAVANVADFRNNYWGDSTGPRDENTPVLGQNDDLNLVNASSMGSRVTDFADWSGWLGESSRIPASTGLIPLAEGFEIVLLHTYTGHIPVFGNNLVACRGGESILVDRREETGDFLVWLSQDNRLDIAAAASPLQIQGIAPAGSNGLQVLAENTDEGVWQIYQLTGPIQTEIPAWMMY